MCTTDAGFFYNYSFYIFNQLLENISDALIQKLLVFITYLISLHEIIFACVIRG